MGVLGNRDMELESKPMNTFTQTPELEADSLEYKDQVATKLAELIGEYLEFASMSDLLNLISANV
jgi:predicted house-cleaning noncanonical NTP pyrophosphatase (MazG superfamily)